MLEVSRKIFSANGSLEISSKRQIQEIFKNINPSYFESSHFNSFLDHFPPKDIPTLKDAKTYDAWLAGIKRFTAKISGFKEYVFENVLLPKFKQQEDIYKTAFDSLFVILCLSTVTHKIQREFLTFYTLPSSVERSLTFFELKYGKDPINLIIDKFRLLLLPRNEGVPLIDYFEQFGTATFEFYRGLEIFSGKRSFDDILGLMFLVGARSPGLNDFVLKHREVSLSILKDPPGKFSESSDMNYKYDLSTPTNTSDNSQKNPRRDANGVLIYNPPITYNDIERFKYPSMAAPWRRVIKSTLESLTKNKTVEGTSVVPKNTKPGHLKWVFGNVPNPKNPKGKFMPAAKLVYVSDPRKPCNIFCLKDPYQLDYGNIRFLLRIFPLKKSLRIFDLTEYMLRLPIPKDYEEKNTRYVRVPFGTPNSKNPGFFKLKNLVSGFSGGIVSSRINRYLMFRSYIRSRAFQDIYIYYKTPREVASPNEPRSAVYFFNGQIFVFDDDAEHPYLLDKSILDAFPGAQKIQNVSHILGAEVVTNPEKMISGLCGKQLIESMFDQFDLKPSSDSFMSEYITPDDEKSKKEISHTKRDFAYIVSHLRFLGLWIRPDIHHKAENLSLHCAAPQVEHWVVLKNLLTYLYETRSNILNFPNLQKLSERKIEGFVDIDIDSTTKRNLSYTIGAFGALIYWYNKSPPKGLTEQRQFESFLVYTSDELVRRLSSLLHDLFTFCGSIKDREATSLCFDTPGVPNIILYLDPKKLCSFDQLAKLYTDSRTGNKVERSYSSLFNSQSNSFDMKNTLDPHKKLFYKTAHPAMLLSGSYSGEPKNALGIFMIAGKK